MPTLAQRQHDPRLDWTGFIVKTTFESVLAIVRGYDRYKDFYKSVVVDSKLLACTLMCQDFYMTWLIRTNWDHSIRRV